MFKIAAYYLIKVAVPNPFNFVYLEKPLSDRVPQDYTYSTREELRRLYSLLPPSSQKIIDTRLAAKRRV